MVESILHRVFRELFRRWPEKQPEEFGPVAARLLFARHLAEYEAALPHVRNGTILDLGSNWGQGLQILAPEAAKVIGAEICLEVAQKSRTLTQFDVVQANGQALPFGDATFDCVVSAHVIEHVWDADAFVREVYRVLKPGGRFVVSTPNQPNSLFHNENPEFDEHLREYLPEELEVLLKSQFEKVEVKGVFGDRDSDDIERRRAWRRPENYYFPGPVFMPLRSLFRLFRKLFLRGRRFTESELRTINIPESDRELTSHFHLGTNAMYRAHHLIAFCEKTGTPRPAPLEYTFSLPNVWKNRRDRKCAKWAKRLLAKGTTLKEMPTALHEPWPAMSDEQVVAALDVRLDELLVVADGPTERRLHRGVRARSINHWHQLLAAAGYDLVDSHPIESLQDALNDRTGLFRRSLDMLLLSIFPWTATCCLILARRRASADHVNRASQYVSGASQHERTHNERAIAELARDTNHAGS